MFKLYSFINCIFIVLLISSCCKDYDNFEIQGSVLDPIHFVKTEKIEKIGSYKLPVLFISELRGDTAPVNKYLDSLDLNFIENQQVFEEVLRIADTFGTLPIFDFNKYVLAPVRYHFFNNCRGQMEFQTIATINHKKEELILSINSQFEASAGNTFEEFTFMAWVAVPRPPNNYTLSIKHN